MEPLKPVVQGMAVQIVISRTYTRSRFEPAVRDH
jgi:hypothetical protein